MRITNFIQTSFIDYPGKLSSVIFTGGCNFRCPSCHAKHIIDGERIIDEKEIISYLDARKNWIEGVVLCGGEPTLQLGLKDFVRKIKKRGFLVKLDTNGSNFGELQNLLDEKIIDYVAMDIKGPSYLYNELTGKRIDLRDDVEKGMMMTTRFPSYEFRTTIAPIINNEEIKFPSSEDYVNMAKWIIDVTGSDTHSHYFQKFVSRNKEEMIDERLSRESLDGKFYETPDEVMKSVHAEVLKYLPNCSIRG